MLVVLYHFGFPGFGGGYVGVDIFFVISGYLMTSIIVSRAGQPHFLWKFYLARATRIIPALFVMVAIVVLVCWWVLSPTEYKQLADHAKSSLLFVSNITYANESGYFDQAARAKWLLHTWSLSVEWQFYLLIPILILAFRRITHSNSALFWLFLLIATYLYASGGFRAEESPVWNFYSLRSRGWELLAGGLVYLAANGLRQVSNSRAIGVVGLVLIVVGVALAAQKPIWPGWLAIVPVLGTALIILAARNTVLENSRLVAWTGSRSYSIYLWHWPIVVYLSLAERLDDPLAVCIGLVVTLAISEVSYRCIEVPARSVSRAAPRTWTAVATLVLMAGIASTWAIFSTDGMETRFGGDAATINELATIAQDWSFPAGEVHDGRISADLPSVSATTRVTAVLGDSHAEQWYARIEAEGARPARVVFLTRGGCLPIPGYDRADIVNQCGLFAEEAWRDVFRLKPDRLVISAQWLNYFLDPSGMLVPVSCLRSGLSCDPVENADDLKALFDLLQANIQQAKDRGIEVVLLGPIPFTQKSYVLAKIQAIASTHLPLNPNPGADWALLSGSISEAGFRRFSAPVANQLARVAAESGIEYIDPAKFMCHGGQCPLIEGDGSPLYKDGSHLRPRTVRGDAMKWLDSVFFGA